MRQRLDQHHQHRHRDDRQQERTSDAHRGLIKRRQEHRVEHAENEQHRAEERHVCIDAREVRSVGVDVHRQDRKRHREHKLRQLGRHDHPCAGAHLLALRDRQHGAVIDVLVLAAVEKREENAEQAVEKYDRVRIVRDDEHDAEKSVNAYNTLKDWGLQVLAGPVTTTPSIAVAAETANDNLFMMTPSASAPTVIESGDNVFQICFTDPNQGVASADYIADNKLGTKVGIIYDSSDAYSSGIYEKFKAEAAAKNLEIVTAEAFTADNKSDLSTQVAKCQEAGADLVFLPIYYQEASQILIAANKSGYEPVFFGCDGMDGILSIDGFDTSLAEGLMLLTPFAADAQDEKTQAFVSAYKEAYGDTPNQFAADAYDVVYAIYEAVLAGGLNGDMDASDICDALKTQFTSMTFDGLTGDSMTWDASGAVSKAPKAVVIKDGAYAAM